MSVRLCVVGLLISVGLFYGCNGGKSSDDTLRQEVVTALDQLVDTIEQSRPPDSESYQLLLETYLEVNPTFFGAAIALIDETGTVTASPYAYRDQGEIQFMNLSNPDYDIQSQEWVTKPLAENQSTWTAPYFDAGGGEIWMVTRSVLARDLHGVFAIVTTDLEIDNPTD